MNNTILILLAFAAVQASATVVNICSNSYFSKGPVDTSSATLVGCARGPCWLTKGRTVSYSLKFTPNLPIGQLTAHVQASRWGIPMTFLDGPSVCRKIFRARDNAPAPCPLRPGEQYIYRDTFRVPTFLPTDQGTVQLALNSGSRNIKCVEIDVRIR